MHMYGQANKKVKNPSFLDFRLELAAQLIGNSASEAKLTNRREN